MTYILYYYNLKFLLIGYSYPTEKCRVNYPYYAKLHIITSSSRHVYDHATFGLALAIYTHLCYLKLTINHPTIVGILSISTNGCHPILFLFVVRYYHSLPFSMVLDINICSWDFNPSVWSATPVLCRAFRFALGQTLFLIKPCLLSFNFIFII